MSLYSLLILIIVKMEDRKSDNLLVVQVLPEDLALLFHQHLPVNTERKREGGKVG